MERKAFLKTCLVGLSSCAARGLGVPAAAAEDGKQEASEQASHNKTIDAMRRAKSCTCPLVKQGLTPSAQCECTLGWQEEPYSGIVGAPKGRRGPHGTSGPRLTSSSSCDSNRWPSPRS